MERGCFPVGRLVSKGYPGLLSIAMIATMAKNDLSKQRFIWLPQPTTVSHEALELGRSREAGAESEAMEG